MVTPDLLFGVTEMLMLLTVGNYKQTKMQTKVLTK